MERARSNIAKAAAYPDAAAELWNTDTSPFTPIDAHATELGVHDCTLDT